MNRLFICLLALGFVGASSLAMAQLAGPVFPTITTQDLNGRTATFPAQMPGERTVVLIAFHRRQQQELDVWIDKLGLKQKDAPAWIEMPVVPNYGSIWRAFVDNGMRSGIVTTEDRARVFTVYGSRDEFRSKLNLPSDDQVYVVVVGKDGGIFARADGQYSDGKASPIRSAIAP
jgi:hypothetical protein